MFIRTILLILLTCAIRNGNADNPIFQLPEPEPDSGITVNEAIEQRRSDREFTGDSITLQELARLLHCAQGITSERGFRAAPSAGGTYPLSVYVIADNVDDLSSGIYEFIPRDNTLSLICEGSLIEDIAFAALGQRCISSAPAAIVIVADYSITTSVYGNRGIMYVHMEAGHVSQNIYLQCTALELGTVAVGAFTDSAVSEILGLGENEIPLYIMPVGRL